MIGRYQNKGHEGSVFCLCHIAIMMNDGFFSCIVALLQYLGMVQYSSSGILAPGTIVARCYCNTGTGTWISERKNVGKYHYWIRAKTVLDDLLWVDNAPLYAQIPKQHFPTFFLSTIQMPNPQNAQNAQSAVYVPAILETSIRHSFQQDVCCSRRPQRIVGPVVACWRCATKSATSL